jgi:cell division protein FtsQ
VPISRLEWSRRETEPRHPPSRRRAAAIVAVVAELIVLVWLLAGSTFAVRTVRILGAHHLAPGQLRRTAGLDGAPSVLGLDVDTIRRRLEQLPWVRSAEVTPMLPGTLEIDIQEWRAVAAYRAAGRSFLLNGQGIVLEQVPSTSGLVEIDGPDKTAPPPGRRVLDPQLLGALVSLDGAFPGATGERVARFVIDSCGDMSLVAEPGFSVIFGRMLTQEEYGSLQPKLAALASLRGTVDYRSKDLDYVNVENPSAPAVHLHSTKPPPSPSPAPSPSPGGIRVPSCR